MRKNILVTGGCGFIGSNFIEYYYNKYNRKDFSIINLDKLTYAANLNNTEEFQHNKNYNFVHGDVCNSELVNYIFSHFDISHVLHFAAESHVDNSILGPTEFFKSNILGTQILLESARRYWVNKNKNLFLYVSTDEVYGSLPITSKHKWSEDEILNPRSPYSASKAGAEHACNAYYHTYNFPVVITRSSNNFGPRQHKEKFLPVIISSLQNKSKIPIYGNGSNIREWLFVKDNCEAIDMLLQKGNAGEVYNIGSNSSISNKMFVNLIINAYCDINSLKANNYNKLISYVEDRAGHDLKYAVSTEKIKKIGWTPPESNSLFSNLIRTIVRYSRL